MENCCFCNKSTEDGRETVILKQKGCDGINCASEERGSNLHACPGQIVHSACRRDYTKKQNITRDSAALDHSPERRSELRSDETVFDFQEDCLFCGRPAKYGLKRRDVDIFQVRTKDFQVSVLEICSTRKDKWSTSVAGRLASVNDLHAADAIYHQQCSVNFRTGKDAPTKYTVDSASSSKKTKLGRPEKDERIEAFLKVMEYLEEHDDCLSTIGELVDKMTEYLSESEQEPYSSKYMRKKIQDHFGERVVMTCLGTKETVITVRETASSILYDFHKQQTAEIGDEKLSIINTAAKLIVSDVKSMEIAGECYPSTDDLKSVDKAMEYIPDSLKRLLRAMFPAQKKCMKLASIGQAIIQAIRPRSLLPPIQLGLGVQMHHHNPSRFVIETLREHGFSASYAEVKRYERSAAVSHKPVIPNVGMHSSVQYVADNVDHNVATLDGKGTFHGMGIIMTVTPGSQAADIPIPKVNASAEDIVAVGKINIEYFKFSPKLAPLIYQPVVRTIVSDPTSTLDTLWKASFLLQKPRPSWSGMMQMLQHADYPGQSCVTFLPMIDLDPSDPSCIFSTLKFVSSQAEKQGVTPVITFDQPLYWKALSITRSQPHQQCLKNIVLRLGGFHTEMSFLGSIGHLMAGSGLQEILEQVYASNTVSHMLTGKAISRAVRGHMLVDAALNTMLIADVYDVPVPVKERDEDTAEVESMSDNIQTVDEDQQDTDLTHARTLFNKAMSSEIPTDQLCSEKVIPRIEAKLAEKKRTLTSRTSILWLQYMDMVDVLRAFLKAERTGNWKLHLQSVCEMLPYLAASGHNLYTKSARVYLQTMNDLPQTHPDVYTMFVQGHHVVRRSDRYWAGLSTDLVIEQALMRSIKTQGGLTRGRGMSELQRLIWILAMPACANMNESMQKLTGVTYETSEQHKDTSTARQSRDLSDTMDILSFIKEHDPFAENDSLVNIANGMTAEKGVNVERSVEVGNKVLESMVNKSVEEFTFRKADHAVTLGSKSNIKVKGQPVKVDPQLIFQRLVFLGERLCDLPSLFKYELCSHPPSLFDAHGLPLEAKKPVLADVIWKGITEEHNQPTDPVRYVLDGGALLHRLPWQRGSTYSSVIQMYVTYVTQKYGSADVVFDGYAEGPTTKDATHTRRTGGREGLAVHFTGGMVIQSSRDEFLINRANKQRFIHLLSAELQNAGCTTHHAEHDADVLIVKTAVATASTHDTVVIGDDTDLLVLLLHYAEPDSCQLFFAPEPRQRSKKTRSWCIQQTKELMGEVVYEHILFAHAILGCDTTSRLFGLGKGIAVNKLKNDATFRQTAKIFSRTGQTRDTIIGSGEKAIVLLYGGKHDDGLDAFRYQRCSDKVLNGAVLVEPQSLPPSSAAAKYHSFRVYYQIMEWCGETELNPTEWGWRLQDGRYVPVQTDIQAAPSNLLDIICCACKTDCSTRRCSCKKYGLPCTAGCAECRGTSCTNCPVIDMTDG